MERESPNSCKKRIKGWDIFLSLCEPKKNSYYVYIQRRKAGAKKVGPTGSSSQSNERLQAARDKHEAQRSRLREMKLAAKRAREQEAGSVEPQEEPLPAAPSPKKSRVGESICLSCSA